MNRRFRRRRLFFKISLIDFKYPKKLAFANFRLEKRNPLNNRSFHQQNQCLESPRRNILSEHKEKLTRPKVLDNMITETSSESHKYVGSTRGNIRKVLYRKTTANSKKIFDAVAVSNFSKIFAFEDSKSLEEILTTPWSANPKVFSKTFRTRN